MPVPTNNKSNCAGLGVAEPMTNLCWPLDIWASVRDIDEPIRVVMTLTGSLEQ